MLYDASVQGYRTDCVQIKPADIEVVTIASRVANGEVWVIKGVNKSS
jgi:hypothetical protein